MDTGFDPEKYYESYPTRILKRPGYPARAAWKSALMWKLFGTILQDRAGVLQNVADIGGCFGFGANALRHQLSERQGHTPQMTVFELSRDFIVLGRRLFPEITFVQEEFTAWEASPEVFDLVTMFDVLEHVLEPETLLTELSKRSRFLMTITPLETTGQLFGGKPTGEYGEAHPDGHVNFFTPDSYESLLTSNGFEIVASRQQYSIVPTGSLDILTPETLQQRAARSILHRMKSRLKPLVMDNHILFQYIIRPFRGGGVHLCLCKSKRTQVELPPDPSYESMFACVS